MSVSTEKPAWRCLFSSGVLFWALCFPFGFKLLFFHCLNHFLHLICFFCLHPLHRIYPAHWKWCLSLTGVKVQSVLHMWQLRSENRLSLLSKWTPEELIWFLASFLPWSLVNPTPQLYLFIFLKAYLIEGGSGLEYMVWGHYSHSHIHSRLESGL